MYLSHIYKFDWTNPYFFEEMFNPHNDQNYQPQWSNMEIKSSNKLNHVYIE